MTNSSKWLPLSTLVFLNASAQATQYATAQEAARRSFPDATAFREMTAQLSSDEMQAVVKAAGLPARSAAWRMLVALNGDKPLGVVVLDGVIGKFELIDYAVGIANDGKIRNLEILAYRESHGYEVRLPGWRKQFVGKDKAAALRVSEDISNISGATMSTTHVTDGVRRIVALVDVLKSNGKL
jgi:Na+-translocating ferredoxin:NAD+ oxidoreductase RnfG subunit